MAILLQHNGLTVEVFDDEAFRQTSASPTSYDKIIQADEDKEYSPNSQHAIKVYRDDKLVRTAIVLASGGGTGIQEGAALIDEGNLIIRCCNKLFSLSLPGLEINWITKADQATCFSIHKYRDTYITYGEMAIARIDRTGRILWKHGGADIFVCLYEGNPFEMHEDHIALTDFNGSRYTIDYNGNALSYEPSGYHDQKPVEVILKRERPWWKFW